MLCKQHVLLQVNILFMLQAYCLRQADKNRQRQHQFPVYK